MVDTLELFNGQITYTEMRDLPMCELELLRDARIKLLEKKQKDLDKITANINKNKGMKNG